MHISRSIRTAAAVATVTGGVVAMMAGPAQAAGTIPVRGDLCKAAENIQFVNGNGENSYVVAKGDSIRIDGDRGAYLVEGHGNGHTTRLFQWKHSDTNYSRVYNCTP